MVQSAVSVGLLQTPQNTMNIDTHELEKAVIKQAVDRLVEQFTDPDHEITVTIQEKAKEIIEKRVNAAIDKEIKRVINDGLEKLMFPNTNAYGEKKKPDMTLREFIADMTNKVFVEYLDSNGKPTSESYYAKPENQRVNRLLKEAVGNAIRDDVLAASNAIKANMNQHVANFIKMQLDEAASFFKK